MITTRDIDVDLEKGIARLDQKTTKDIDVSIKPGKPKKETKPKKVIRPQSISTHNMPDVADILEKKKRDEIIAEMKEKPKLVEPSKELMAELTKKPWNKMNAKERKEYQVEKARAAKGKKK